eukprot:6480319-Amphidinium_carterae.2
MPYDAVAPLLELRSRSSSLIAMVRAWYRVERLIPIPQNPVAASSFELNPSISSIYAFTLPSLEQMLLVEVAIVAGSQPAFTMMSAADVLAILILPIHHPVMSCPDCSNFFP